MEVECPDGSRVRIASCEDGHVFGRKHLGVAADDSISREQFRLSVVQGGADVAQLHVLGRNGNIRLHLITRVASLVLHVCARSTTARRLQA